MKKNRWVYVVFGLVFYLLFLIVELPPSWFAWALNYYTHNTVRLDPHSGSLWHGKGRLVIYYPQTVPHDFGQTEWSINPFWLFAGHVQMSWRAETPDAKIYATLRFGKNQTQLIETEATIPAQTVSAFYPAASLISPRGQVSLRSKKLAIGASGIEGDVEILWRSATSGLSAVQPLGDYRLEVNGTGKTAALKLSTAQGVLDLTGQGQFQMDTKQIQLTGSAVARERQAELEPLLKLFGDDRGNGKRLLTMNGRLPL